MARGIDRERAIVHELEAAGWVAWRSRGSLGAVDVFAVKAGERPRVIQVKSTSRGGPFQAFGPADRRSVREMAAKAGVSAWLVHWPPRKPAQWIPEADWPE